MQVTIRFFAGHRDIVGRSEQIVTIAPDATVGMVWEQLVAAYPRLAGYTGRLLYAVNQEFSTLDSPLHDGDEVAFIPPVSGGSPEREVGVMDVQPYLVTNAPIDPAPLVLFVQTANDGAVVTFAGVVRNHFDDRSTAYLIYEAYADMAAKVFAQLADEARTRWRIGKVAVHHRIGRLEIGETAVLVVVAAPHRGPAFEAAAFIMDRIKEVAPIWKQEHWADGEREWRE
ncbi:MAG: molybdopterin converting factor [Oscillochloris sp.]|nr:molybdopterin converting factor [Oscillochloris sp.]